MSDGIFQIGGLVSGLNTGDIVTKIITADSGQKNQLLAQQKTVVDKMTAYQELSANLVGLQTTAQQLSQSSTYAQFSASSSNQQTLSASADVGAAAGTYQVTVKQLAQSEQDLSQGYADPNASVLGTGNVTIQVGSAIFGPLAVDSTNNSLQGLANAINGASMGVQAAVVNDGSNYHLMLTGNSSGASQKITVTSSLSGTAPTFQALQTAQDAIVDLGTASTLEVHSATNKVSGLLPGVTLTLNQQDPSNPVTVSVKPDASNVRSQIDGFISAFNQASSFLRAATAYDASTGQAGPLQGDSAAVRIQSDLARLVTGNVVNDTFHSLAQIGITVDGTGNLQVTNGAALTNALSSNLGKVQAMFSDPTNGVMAQMKSYLQNTTDPSKGLLSLQIQGLQDTDNQLTTSIDQQTAFLKREELDLQGQFSAMEATLGSLQSQSSLLASLGVSTTPTTSTPGGTSSSFGH